MKHKTTRKILVLAFSFAISNITSFANISEITEKTPDESFPNTTTSQNRSIINPANGETVEFYSTTTYNQNNVLFIIFNSNGMPVYEISNITMTANIKSTFYWNGFSSTGQIVPDGTYTAHLIYNTAKPEYNDRFTVMVRSSNPTELVTITYNGNNYTQGNVPTADTVLKGNFLYRSQQQEKQKILDTMQDYLILIHGTNIIILTVY